jgi:anti-anti-sigma factor
VATIKPFIFQTDVSEWDIAYSNRLAWRLVATHDAPSVIVDMSNVTYVDSTCLGKLIRMRCERSERGFPPALIVLPSQHLRRVFEIVGFDKIWRLFDTLDEAIQVSRSEAVA